MTDNTPAAQPATVDDTAQWEAEISPSLSEFQSLYESAHAALLRLVPNGWTNGSPSLGLLTQAVASKIEGLEAEVELRRSEVAAKDARIAVLQRSWGKAHRANTAWLDGGGVVLPEDAVKRLDDVGFAWTVEERNAIVKEVRSWRPATEPAEAAPDAALREQLREDYLAECDISEDCQALRHVEDCPADGARPVEDVQLPVVPTEGGAA